MIILGIETSCDETAAAVVQDGTAILSNTVASQIPLHVMTGGVVPEVASREHVGQINGVVASALADAGVAFPDLDGVAVANRPGLMGALLVGVTAAKAIAYARRLPLFGVHHIEAHIYANYLGGDDIWLPAVSLVASGGHTALFHVKQHGDYEILGSTRDDAAGEAFDKTARILGLPYPGGAAMNRLAESGNAQAVTLPRAWLSAESLDFSFSGLKTAVGVAWRAHSSEHTIEDWCASIQAAIVDVLVAKTIRAAESLTAKQVLLAGGVAANTSLRDSLASACTVRGIAFHAPPPHLCTDNAAMIAAAAYFRFKRDGSSDDLTLDTIASEALA